MYYYACVSDKMSAGQNRDARPCKKAKKHKFLNFPPVIIQSILIRNQRKSNKTI